MINLGSVRRTFGANKLFCQFFSSPEWPDASVQPDLTQVVLDDDVSDGVEHKLHILGVCGTGELGVDLLDALAFIQVLKLTVDVFGRLLVRLPTCSRQEQKPALFSHEVPCLQKIIIFNGV